MGGSRLGAGQANAQAELDEQARLSRIAARREALANAPEDAAHAFEQAVARVGAEWSRLILDRPSWRQAMHKARVDENLGPEHGRRICEAWDREAVGGVSAGQPAKSKIWGGWSADAEWRRRAAGLGEASPPKRSGMKMWAMDGGLAS